MSVPLIRIGDVCEQIRGVTYSKLDASKEPRDGYRPILRAGNIENGAIIFDDLVYVPAEKIGERQLVRAGDVVIAASSGSLSAVGKAAQAVTDFEGAFGAFCKVLRPSSTVNARYFGHYFRTDAYKRHVAKVAAGANINNLRNEHLDDLTLRLPPLEEQQRTAAVLDQVDALRAKRRHAIALLDDLTHSIFLEMFGDQLTNVGRVVNLDMVLERKLSNGISPSSRGDVKAKVLTLSAVTGESFNSSAWKVGTFTQDPTPTYAVTTNLFMVCRGNGNRKLVGKGVFADVNMVDTVYPDTVLAAPIRPEMITREYLTHVWATPQVRHQIESAARTTNGTYKVNQKTMGAVTFWLPQLEEQRAFQRKVLAIRHTKQDHESHLAALDELFTSLQQRAFSGTLWDHEAAA
ncbi:restriction endonuclease subunit S [Streptomyces cellulosae]